MTMITATGTLLLLLVGTWGFEWIIDVRPRRAVRVRGEQAKWSRPDPTPAPPTLDRMSGAAWDELHFPQAATRTFQIDGVPSLGDVHPWMSDQFVATVTYAPKT